MNRSNAELMQLSDLIGLIYEGATDSSRWTKDILPVMAEYVESPVYQARGGYTGTLRQIDARSGKSSLLK